jgi:predicted Zn-dependent protease
MATIDTTFIRRFLAAHPDHIAERLHLARLLAHNGCPDEALRHYRQAREQLRALLTQEPATPGLYEQLAEAQAAIGDDAGARFSAMIAAYLKQRQHIS